MGQLLEKVILVLSLEFINTHSVAFITRRIRLSHLHWMDAYIWMELLVEVGIVGKDFFTLRNLELYYTISQHSQNDAVSCIVFLSFMYE